MEEELLHPRISVVIHVAAGIVMGFLSPYAGRALFALGLMIAGAIVTGFITEKIVGRRGIKWWAANGLFIYIFAWFCMWVFSVNFFQF